MLGTLDSEGGLVVLAHASLVGSGGTVFQWQNLLKLVACTVAEKLHKTLRFNCNGTPKRNRDRRRWALSPMGHCNWK